MLNKIVEDILYFIIINLIKFKKTYREKLIVYLKYKELMFKRDFNINKIIEIEIGEVGEIFDIHKSVLKFKEDSNPFYLKSIKDLEVKNISIRNLFKTNNRYIDNVEEIHYKMLNMILEIYNIDNEFIKNEKQFSSISLQPHIILLEKYLRVFL